MAMKAFEVTLTVYDAFGTSNSLAVLGAIENALTEARISRGSINVTTVDQDADPFADCRTAQDTEQDSKASELVNFDANKLPRMVEKKFKYHTQYVVEPRSSEIPDRNRW